MVTTWRRIHDSLIYNLKNTAKLNNKTNTVSGYVVAFSFRVIWFKVRLLRYYLTVDWWCLLIVMYYSCIVNSWVYYPTGYGTAILCDFVLFQIKFIDIRSICPMHVYQQDIGLFSRAFSSQNIIIVWIVYIVQHRSFYSHSWEFGRRQSSRYSVNWHHLDNCWKI